MYNDIYMKVFVDDAINIHNFDVNHDMAIIDLKECIENNEFIPTNMISLSYNSRLLHNNELVVDVCEDGGILDFRLELFGGMRRKWRKKRMRRMKRLRRKMRARAK